MATKQNTATAVNPSSVAKWQHGATIKDLATSLRVQAVGESYNTGKLDANGAPIHRTRKSFRVDVPAKPDGLSGDAALNRAIELGTAIKSPVMGRVAAFAADSAVIVRKYAETPGKHDKISLVLEKMAVEGIEEKIARSYKITVEEVRKRLSTPELITV